jgi:DEAD/DEAH box helicase domain-containing protein
LANPSSLEALVNEREALRKRVRSLGTRIRRLRQTSVKPQNWEEELEALQREREGLQELVASIDGKETVNFFTDEGWIPNYAFPKAGVTLRSVIWRRRREEEEEGRRYETWSYEYTRAAAVSLSELAPSSHFYAEGRRVQVDQVDLRLSQPRDWRLSRNCAHAEEILIADPPAAACPRCGDVTWPDKWPQAADAAAAASVYQHWLSEWFAREALRLATFYRQLGIAGFA